VILQAIKQREAEEKLEKNKRQFQNTIDIMLEGVQIISSDWRYLYVNETVAKQGKYCKEELLGHTMMEKYPGIENTEMFRAIGRCMTEKTPVFMENKFDYPDGTSGWFELSIQPLPEGVFILSIDITQRKEAIAKLMRAEIQVRNFAEHLNKTIEEERGRIAREIHDEFGQQLSGLKIGIGSLRNGENDSRVEGMLKDVDKTIQSLREIATELRPGILDTLGLIPSLEWLTNEFSRKTNINCKFKSEIEEQKFEKNISTCFFRICQESLTNISKHAQATEVNIFIDIAKENEEEVLIMKIYDNGKGISNEKLDNPFSMGLLGMRERANMVGGKLDITSEKNKGTVVQLQVNKNEAQLNTNLSSATVLQK
jgi:PAS domain S-box-containing protein